jgi:transposase
MLRVDYTDEDRNAFDHWRYHYPEVRIMRRFEMLWLHAHGMSTSEIAKLVNKTSVTVRNVIHLFQDGGIELVMTIDSNHPKSKLEPHRTSIIEEFTRHPPATAKEAAHRIEKLTGIKLSAERVRVFMKNLGMECRKVGAIPAKADLEKQEEYKKTR